MKKLSWMCTTYRRMRCVERIIGMFYAQTYKNKELIIFNTDEEYPVKLSFSDSRIKVINNHLDYTTGLLYDNTGQIRRDAATHLTGDYFMLADDDDIYLPWNFEQAVEGIELINKKSWKPNKSFSRIGGKIKFEGNVMEASVIVDMNVIREVGFKMGTYDESMRWYMHLKNTGQLNEKETRFIPAYCFNWSDPPGWSDHKQSSHAGAVGNFNNHKLKSRDFAARPLNLLSNGDLELTYKPFFDWLLQNKYLFDLDLWNKYVAKHVDESNPNNYTCKG